MKLKSGIEELMRYVLILVVFVAAGGAPCQTKPPVPSQAECRSLGLRFVNDTETSSNNVLADEQDMMIACALQELDYRQHEVTELNKMMFGLYIRVSNILEKRKRPVAPMGKMEFARLEARYGNVAAR